MAKKLFNTFGWNINPKVNLDDIQGEHQEGTQYPAGTKQTIRTSTREHDLDRDPSTYREVDRYITYGVAPQYNDTTYHGYAINGTQSIPMDDKTARFWFDLLTSKKYNQEATEYNQRIMQELGNYYKPGGKINYLSMF